MVTNYRSNEQRPLKNPKKPAECRKTKSIRHRGGRSKKFDFLSCFASKKHDNRKAPTMITAEALYQAMVEKGNWTDSWSSFNERIENLESLRFIDTYKRDLPNGEQVTEIVLLYDAKEILKACGDPADQ